MKNLPFKLFLVRHADYAGDGPDPELSDFGLEQSLRLARKLNNLIPGDVTIWTSPAKRAFQTAELIQQELSSVRELVTLDKLWSDYKHDHDFTWLRQKLSTFEGKSLIIVSHLEYVQDFPACLGLPRNSSGYAEGVMIHSGECRAV